MGLCEYKNALDSYEQCINNNNTIYILAVKLQGTRVSSTTSKGRISAKKAFEEENNKSTINNGNEINSNEMPIIKSENENVNIDTDDVLDEFFSEIVEATNPPQKQEKRLVDDTPIETSTPFQQLNRLLQVNYKWKNLNPFVVLMLPEVATKEDIKQRYYKV